ncbi:MAG TPA: S8 family peptidase [Thermoanaerobaculia bacterium]|jgi:subtilisin family serine protease
MAPLYNDKLRSAIEGQFIVVFHNEASSAEIEAAADKVRAAGGHILKRYFKAVLGFSASVPAEAAPAVRESIRALTGVAWVEVDQTVKAQSVQRNPPHGLDRIDHRLLPLDKRYAYTQTGKGVNVYVIDSGIFIEHKDFGGRAFAAYPPPPANSSDLAGHGTHVAGTIGGTTFGVAKDVHLFAVRVLDAAAQGDVSDIVAGIDWVAANAVPPAVANVSIELNPSKTVDTAVGNSIAQGITYIVAAGNGGVDACSVSPARVREAITVGAAEVISLLDSRVISQSNVGTCVDLFAPGLDIESAWIGSSKTNKKLLDGTSTAAAHVSGVAALYLENHPKALPMAVWSGIHSADNVSGTPNWTGISDLGAGSPNELLHWGPQDDGTNDGDSQKVRKQAKHRRKHATRHPSIREVH